MASAQDWANAQTVGRPNANSATLHDYSTADKRAAEFGASLRTACLRTSASALTWLVTAATQSFAAVFCRRSGLASAWR